MASKATSKKGKADVKVHDVIDLDNKSLPIPTNFDNAGFVSLGGFNYIPFFNPDDDQFKKLLTLRLLSPTQNSCIGDKVFYSVGDGLQIRDKEFPAAFDRKINNKRQLIDDILTKIFDGLYQDGNKFIEVARVTVGSKRLVHVYEHSNLDCRLEEDPKGYDPTYVIRSREFRKTGMIKNVDKGIRIPLWTDLPMPGQKVWMRDELGVERTMFHIKNDVSGVDGYGLPSNFAGLMQTALEYKSSKFNLDNFENNMFIGGVLMIQGSMSPDDEKKLMRNIKKMHTGDGTYNRIMTLTSQEGITDSKFIPFSENKEGHFLELDNRVEEKIISANQWSKEIMDLKDGSGLGKGDNYLKTLFKAKYRTVIKPSQDKVMNNFIWPLMSIIDEHTGSSWSKEDWFIKPAIPVSFEGELDINSLLTVDEGREEIGRKAIGGEVGKKMVSEVGKNQANPQQQQQQKQQK